jgi:universal stress protein A
MIMENINRILVVSWITQACREPVRFGISLAEKYQAELSVIHVVNTLWTQGWNLPKISLLEEQEKDRKKAKRELDKIIDSEKKKGMSIRVLIKEGNPVEGILKTVEDEKIDLIVLRAHEAGLLENFLISGSNDAIIRKMPCSIVLVKSEPGPALI